MKRRTIYYISGIVFATLVVFLIIRFNRFYQKIPSPGEDIVVNVPEPKMLFGLRADSFHIEESWVTKNQNLSDILIDRGVSAQSVDQIAKNSVAVFDVRKMKAGNRYSMFYSKDSKRVPIFMVYQNNGVDYYIYSLTDSLKVLPGKHEGYLFQKLEIGCRIVLWLKGHLLHPPSFQPQDHKIETEISRSPMEKCGVPQFLSSHFSKVKYRQQTVF